MKLKGEIISLKKLLQILHRLNTSVPEERRFLDALFHEKQSSAQSCDGRCFLEERSDPKWCYCDMGCKAWGDCCLDLYVRYDSSERKKQ